MQLTEAEQQTLDENQTILEMAEHPGWKLLRARMEAAQQNIRTTLANTKLRDWDHYMTLRSRLDGIGSVLGEVDDAVPAETERLQKKLELEPDNRPATGHS